MKRPNRGGNRDGTDRGIANEGPPPDGGTVRHIPVLLKEVLAALAPKAGERFIDGTFGAGGYTRALLGVEDVRVLAIDRDPRAIAEGRRLAEAFPGRLTLAHKPFSEMEAAASAIGWDAVAGAGAS